MVVPAEVIGFIAAQCIPAASLRLSVKLLVVLHCCGICISSTVLLYYPLCCRSLQGIVLVL